MAESVKSFLGTWRINLVASAEPPWEVGYLLEVGTGQNGAQEPFLNEESQICVGFAILAPNSDGSYSPVLSSADSQQQPLVLMFVNGVLRWQGYYQTKPLQVFISAADVSAPLGSSTWVLYGTTAAGDPQQVGIWGAEASPPPPP